MLMDVLVQDLTRDVVRIDAIESNALESLRVSLLASICSAHLNSIMHLHRVSMRVAGASFALSGAGLARPNGHQIL